MRDHVLLQVRCRVMVRIQGGLTVKARLRLTYRVRVMEAPRAKQQCNSLP